MAKQSTAMVGACGEHYVAAYLSGFHLLVALPRAGVPGTDLFVSKERGGRVNRVQVKTGTQATKTTKAEGPIYLWHTSYKSIESNDNSLWYAYVWLNNWPQGELSPEIFFVPSSKVAECIKGCQDDGDKVPFFWMTVAEAKKYKGRPGLDALMESLNSPEP